jgi:hypothetical protein
MLSAYLSLIAQHTQHTTLYPCFNLMIEVKRQTGKLFELYAALEPTLIARLTAGLFSFEQFRSKF